MCVFVVLGRLFGDFGEGARLRDGDQLTVRGQRHVLLKMESLQETVSPFMRKVGVSLRQGTVSSVERNTQTMRKAGLTHLSPRKFAPSSLADVVAPLGLAEARCGCCWRYHSSAGTGLRVDARRPSSVRERQYSYSAIRHQRGLTSDSEVLRPPRHDEQIPIECARRWLAEAVELCTR